ncbi:Hypothetical protein GLP15_4901 [Giardia lamblia P15]|uniref:DNA2/NAM7 helicase-like C-terminal domain-containing protein n=1 Tax=Giardia intestinalis (strain P15) TaxID=658858 RepID=E1F9S4_GIAIA|nr:Hypothetical protein GLP15_4901 [Giardia lamblia P15]
MELQKILSMKAYSQNTAEESDKFLASIFGYFSVEDPIDNFLKDIELFASDFIDFFVLKRKCQHYWNTIITQKTIPQAKQPFFKTCESTSNTYTVKSLYLRDTFLLTDVHLHLQRDSFDLVLLNRIKAQICSGIKSQKQARRLAMFLYVACKLLLTNGYVNGKFDDIANNIFNGEIVFLLINAFNAIFPWVGEHLFIFEPIISLLAELFLYAFGCTKNKHKHEKVHSIFSKLLGNKEKSSVFSVPIVDVCLSVIVSSSTKSSVTKLSKDKRLPIQNLDIRMLLASCRLLLCILSVQNNDDETQTIDYIEHKIKELCPMQNIQCQLLPRLLFLLTNLIDQIKPDSLLSQDVIDFLKEATVALILCTNYDRKLVDLFNNEFHAYVDNISGLIESLYITKVAGAKAKPCFGLTQILSDVLHASVLGDPIRRYMNRTLLLQSNLLPLVNIVGYFWCQQYHYITSIYANVIIDIQRDECEVDCDSTKSVKQNGKKNKNLLALSKEKIQTKLLNNYSVQLTIPISWKFVDCFVKYNERDQLELVPLIYVLSIETKEILAIYIPSHCGVFAGNEQVNKLKLEYYKNSHPILSSGNEMVEHDPYSKQIGSRLPFKLHIELYDFHYGVYDFISQMQQRNSSTGLFFHWYHPSIGLHIEIVKLLKTNFATVYFAESGDNVHMHRLFCLSEFNNIRLPSCSFIGYGYSTVSSQPFSYIKDVLKEVCERVYQNDPSVDIPIKLKELESAAKTTAELTLYDSTPGTQSNIAIFKDLISRVNGKKVSHHKEFTHKILRPSQFKALMYAALSPLTLILGCPGSGKSTTLAHISKMFLLEENALSKWIPALDNKGVERNRPKWNQFKDLFFSSIKTYESVTEMVLDKDVGVQLFITAHSNNAADQLTRYILEMDGWDKTTFPFIVRLGTQSLDSNVLKFMPIYYLYRIALELGVQFDPSYDKEDKLKAGDLTVHFMNISKAIRDCTSGPSSSKIYSKLTRSQKDVLDCILRDIRCLNYKLLSSATIIVSTTSGFSIYLRYFTDMAIGDPTDFLSSDPLGSSKDYNGYDRPTCNQLSRSSSESYMSKRNSYDSIMAECGYASCKSSSSYNKLVRTIGASSVGEENRRRYLIVEEAARLAEHEFASFLVAPFNKIILLGDILQLPPLIQDQTIASSGALDWSVFHRICYSPQVSVPIVTLEEQARSVPEIADLYRSLYESSLPKYCSIKGGLRDIPGVKFDSFVDQAILERFRGRCFYIPNKGISKCANLISAMNKRLADFCQQMKKYQVVQKQSEDQWSKNKRGGAIRLAETNSDELKLISYLLYSTLVQVTEMIFSGSHVDKLVYDSREQEYCLRFSIAILSLYNAQAALLRSDQFISDATNLFKDLRIPAGTSRRVRLSVDVSVSTSDAFQGLEADIVFLSMVKRATTDFIDSLPRALVAVSRARRLIICIGAADKSKNEIWMNVAKQSELDLLGLLNEA